MSASLQITASSNGQNVPININCLPTRYIIYGAIPIIIVVLLWFFRPKYVLKINSKDAKLVDWSLIFKYTFIGSLVAWLALFLYIKYRNNDLGTSCFLIAK